ncbi:hypothetical protein SmJEL517_g03425 [Synchytrium microbalum]|uniref:RNA polymerase II transcription factor B subunit 2 n=1 Tax=Synchytrium microbalum TaxID=1806994 RepID=A0A507C6W0_9FUNG|nr:uncharacterized protein SmJEL517_g03425 [Synchytrium microbalum]TPX33716.1 hypothetical protein SmJEL517_g03425 [Synchytrium microbalum]
MALKQPDIWTYLKDLAPPIRAKVYAQPASALAVLRLMPEPSRHLILRLLYAASPIPAKLATNWFYDGSMNKLKDAIKTLRNLYILVDPPSQGPAPGGKAPELKLKLNETFQLNLHRALTLSGDTNSFGKPPDTPDKHATSILSLDEYSNKQWEASAFDTGIFPTIAHTAFYEDNGNGLEMLMVKSGLMVKSYNGTHITNKGFAFLLQDLHTQVWSFLVHYLEMCEDLKMDAVQVLHLIFTFASLKLGQDYAVDCLTIDQTMALQDFKPLGLVYQRKKGSARFYPTRMATTLISGCRITDKPPSDSGFIMLETNYRVYAYTSSPLQISVLGLFVQMRARFSNMVVGLITRDSVRKALYNGITANQIISYLHTHAHPEMAKQTPVLPPTVVDQIRLWEMERNRLKFFRGYLYQNFSSPEDWKKGFVYATEVGALIWSNEQARQFFVTEEGHPLVKTFVGSLRRGV